jgi:hypothetical protein
MALICSLIAKCHMLFPLPHRIGGAGPPARAGRPHRDAGVHPIKVSGITPDCRPPSVWIQVGRVFGSLGTTTKLGHAAIYVESKIRSLKIDKNRFKTADSLVTTRLAPFPIPKESWSLHFQRGQQPGVHLRVDHAATAEAHKVPAFYTSKVVPPSLTI